MSHSNAEFLTSLSELFKSTAQLGRTVFLNQKRFTHLDPGTVEEDTGPSSRQYPCLIRATNGQKIKFSTLVLPNELAAFHQSYSSIIRSSLTTLHPKRSKKPVMGIKKRKLNPLEPSKLYQSLPLVSGPKRGAGVEKRRRLIKQRMKIINQIRKRQLAKAKPV